MTTPTRNVELLQRVMDHIDAHPEQHAQEVWLDPDTIAIDAQGRPAVDCGTAACFAGWAALLTFAPADVIDASTGTFKMLSAPCDGYGFSFAAAMLLGLTYFEADTLFEQENTREMLRLMVADLVAGSTLQECDYYADLVTTEGDA